MEESTNQKEVGTMNPFAKGGLSRSPPLQNQHGHQSRDKEQQKLQQQSQQQPQKQQQQMHQPKQNVLNKTMPEARVLEAKSLVDELHSFVDARNNIHKEIKKMVHRIRKVVVSAVKEYETIVERANTAELTLTSAKVAAITSSLKQGGTSAASVSSTKQGKEGVAGVDNVSVSITPKRPRTSPGDERPGGSKRPIRLDEDSSEEAAEQKEGWNSVAGQKTEKKKESAKAKGAEKIGAEGERKVCASSKDTKRGRSSRQG
ncbi:myb-like protein AA [Malaya genurostris]|uniref:myb-like protein AA n=1 Tax=Malaya genurostris TaxID=325434 RepID=UPI0026F38E76|nr:myb-like protein AA [Malaya genurostris]